MYIACYNSLHRWCAVTLHLILLVLLKCEWIFHLPKCHAFAIRTSHLQFPSLKCDAFSILAVKYPSLKCDAFAILAVSISLTEVWYIFYTSPYNFPLFSEDCNKLCRKWPCVENIYTSCYNRHWRVRDCGYRTFFSFILFLPSFLLM